jgi:hypothetical protein
VTLRAEFRVERGERRGECVLVKDVEVECARWMMPFVGGKVEEAHRDVCWRVVEMMVEEERERGGMEKVTYR